MENLPVKTSPHTITNINRRLSSTTLSLTVYTTHSKTSLSELGAGVPQFIVLTSVSPNCTGTERPWTIYPYGKDRWPEHHGKIYSVIGILCIILYFAREDWETLDPWGRIEGSWTLNAQRPLYWISHALVMRPYSFLLSERQCRDVEWSVPLYGLWL